MNIVQIHAGDSPLIISCPHDGSEIPPELAGRMLPEAQIAPDTDWYISRLYAPLSRHLEATVLVPRYSRYVVDLNRAPDGAALYPGRQETGLVPTLRFDGEAVYRPGYEPQDEEIADRVERYWRPYHRALQAQIQRVLDRHGRVLLWEAHSIRAEVPMFFEGRLPDLNIGTADGRTVRPDTAARIAAALAAPSGYRHVINGRFKGGYITRHYADPERGIEAVQLEMAQACYMDEAGAAWDEAKASAIQPTMLALLGAALA